MIFGLDFARFSGCSGTTVSREYVKLRRGLILFSRPEPRLDMLRGLGHIRDYDNIFINVPVAAVNLPDVGILQHCSMALDNTITTN